MAFFKSVPGVEEITLDDFDLTSGSAVLKGGKDGMLLVYASYCGYCTMVKPEWMKLGKLMKDMPGKVYALQGDTPKNQDLFKYMTITTVPDIRYVNSSGNIDSVKYGDDRTAEGFAKYYKSKSSSKAKSTPKPKKKSATKKKSPEVQDGGARRKKRNRRAKKTKKSTKSVKPSKKMRANKKIKVQNKKKKIKNIKF